jgi:hypothetical protein
MTTIEQNVGIDPNYAGGCYIIKSDAGVSTLGFDVCLGRIERYALNLGILDIPKAERGSRAAYDVMQTLMDALREIFEETGERAVADLSPQLNGLEGFRVEVVDEPGEAPRRFIVGRSTGWLPCHLEIPRRDSSGGLPARLEYHSVRTIERVR